ncbi:MAG: alpha/beta hydrolase [Verrucomicrobiales bacterium]|nr:alpha/beta hydrolase [Verrucomicrobiales bacterium]
MDKPIQFLADREKLLLEKAQAKTYSSVEGRDLRIHFYFPGDFSEGDARTVILFFNGGAWDRGNVIQFAPHALHFVDRGAVCGLVEYRDRSSFPQATPLDAVSDARAAIQFVRVHAERLGVDSSKVVAVGAGAGGNLVGNAVLSEWTAAEGVDFRPDAAAMYSPIIDVEKGGYGSDEISDPAVSKTLSLSRKVATGHAPVLLLHGTADRLIPIDRVREFARRLQRKRNECYLVELEGRDQNFFNLNVDPMSFEIVLSETDSFLEGHGLLERAAGTTDTRVISWREEDP